MVGVAGRSKGCKTCKQRKIACSLEKPHCQTCIKSKRECGGYKQEMVFVMDPRSVKAAPKTKPKSKTATTHQITEIASPASTIDLPFREPEAQIRQITSLQATIPTSSAFKHISSITSPSIRAIYREQIISEFLHAYLPPIRIAGPGSWLALLPTHPHFTSALESTSLAVSTACLGRLNSDKALVRESLKFYTQGLWELQKALWNEETMYRDETLAACLTLIMYEVLECPDQSTKAWIGHMKGCAKLVELRGPRNFTSDFGRMLFSSFRSIEIPQAITERRSTFLSQKDWVEIPWQGQFKPPAHYILDLMADIAEGIEIGYKALGDPTTITSIEDLTVIVSGILKRAWSQDVKLEALFKRLESQAKGPLYWPQLSTGYNKSILPNEEVDIFPVAFQFPDMSTAHTCLLYWATCSILWSGMSFIYGFLSALPTSPTTSTSTTTTTPNSDSTSTPDIPQPPPPNPLLAQLPPLGHRADVSIIAKNICQTMEYYIQSKESGASNTTCIFPLKVAIEALNDTPGCEKELAWAKEVFMNICGKGVKILGNLGIDITEHSYLPG